MDRVRFPNESAEYRSARDRLLEAEVEARRQLESVAALRRSLPAGGKVPEDYLFEGADGPVRMSSLFERGNTLVAYGFMYGPAMENACPMCTSMLDGLDASAAHIAQRTDLVVIARSPIARILEHARSRGWKNLRLLSSHANSYHPDNHADVPDGSQLPKLNEIVKDGDGIRHFWASELFFADHEPGTHPRHVDLLWPLWNVLDLTPEGRGKDWTPKLKY